MPDRHNAFIHDENLRNFERQLAAEEDPDKRLLLQQLLAEEKARKLPAPIAPPSPKSDVTPEPAMRPK